MKRVSPKEANKLMKEESFSYVDVRSVEEFQTGHPLGAYNVPWKCRSQQGLVPNKDFMRVMEGVFEKEAPIIIGCQSGKRSQQAAMALEEAGFSNLVEQKAGFMGCRDAFGQMLEPGWQSQGLPVSHESDRNYGELMAKAIK